MGREIKKTPAAPIKGALWLLALASMTAACGGGGSGGGSSVPPPANGGSSFSIPSPGGLLSEVGVGLTYMESSDYRSVSSVNPQAGAILEGSDYRLVGVSVAAGVSRLSE